MKRRSISNTTLISSESGLQYIKVHQSADIDRQVLDVMFGNGLRVTADLLIGHPAADIINDIRSQLMSYRPTSWENHMEALVTIAKCIEISVRDSTGMIQPLDLEHIDLNAAWDQAKFMMLLRARRIKARFPYEIALLAIRQEYEDEISDDSNNSESTIEG